MARPNDEIESRSRSIADDTDLSTRESQVYACLEAGLSPEEITDRYDWGVSDYSPSVAHVRQYADGARSKCLDPESDTKAIGCGAVKGVFE